MPEEADRPAQIPRIHSPVRDESALGPSENLDREPDAIPHSVIALVAFTTVVVAAVLLVYLSGHAPRHPGAVLFLAFALPTLAALAILIARRWQGLHGSHATR